MKHLDHWRAVIACIFLISLCVLGCSKEEITEDNILSQQAPLGYADNFYGVSFINPQKGWAVGYYGLVAYTEDGGKTWSRQNCDTQDPLFRVNFVDENNGWIVGKFARIHHTSDGGKSYSIQESPVEEDFFDVSFVDAQNGWVVGTFGTILHTSDGGKTWERQGEEGVDKIYNTVFFADKNHGWIGGEFATILRTEDGGAHWEETEVPLDTGYSIFGMHFSDHNTGVAVGMDGAILVTEDGGATWELINSPVRDHLFGVSSVNTNAWAVGLRGRFLLTDQANLKNWVLPAEAFQIKYWLNDICFVDENHGWMVGAHGVIRRTTDGGKTWMIRE